MITLNTYANGDTNYVAKMDADNLAIAAAINAIQTALGTLGGGGAVGQLLNALFGSSTAFIGNTSYTQGTSGTIINIAGGYAWRPDLGNVLSKSGSTAIDFSGQSAATYYIVLGADGTPARSSSSTGALYSVVWTGSAFGTIAAVAPIVPNGDVVGTYQTLTIVAGAVTLTKMANLAANSIIGNNTGAPATPIALTAAQVRTLLSLAAIATSGSGADLSANSVANGELAQMPAHTVKGNNTGSTANAADLTVSQVKTLLAITDADITYAAESANKIFAGPASGGSATPGYRSSVIADLPFAGVASGVATLDGSGKVPTSQLPAAVVGALSYAGTWNANTNTPPLVSSTGSQGTYYKVATAGATTIDGISQWNVGDSIVFDGTVWDKIDGIANEVVSVAALTGAITASALKTALAIAAGDVSGLAAIATSGSASDLTAGTVPAARMPAFTSDVTSTVGTVALTIAANAVTNAKAAQMAADTIKGNNTSGTANAADLTVAQIKTLLAYAIGDLANIADQRIVGNNSGGSGPPITLTAAQVKTLLAIASGDVSGLAASATTDTTNASNINSGTLNRARLPTMRFDVSVCFPGVPTASQVVTYVAARAITIDHTAPGNCAAGTASTGTATFNIKKNGSAAATAVFTASATGAYTISSDIVLAAGDILTFTSPASPDATLADIGITLAGLA